jgi:1-acyl-sn-glycerol-3-phosphate acyltransferase
MSQDLTARSRDRASERDRPYTTTNYRFGRFARTFLIPIVNLLFRIRILGLENIPQGAAILAGNHVSYADPVVLWGNAPRLPHMVAKSELWDLPIIRWILDGAGVFPVHRDSLDRTFLQTATRLLDEGHLLGIFPEGTRHREPGLGEGNEGVAFIAIRANVPVVPVGIAGTDKIVPPGAKFPRLPRVTIVVGEPLFPEDVPSGSRKERVTMFTGTIMEAIECELERAEGGAS